MKGKTGVKNRRLLFAKNSILMLVMLVVIFLAIFAWYYIQKNVTATGITITAAEPDEVEIAVTEGGADTGIFGSYETANNTTTFSAGRWAESVNFNGPFQFSTDVTSDGANFIVPGFSSTEDNETAKADARNNGKIVNPNAIPTEAINNLTITQAQINEGKTPEYYSVPFYLRSKSPNVYVKASAYLAMGVENGVYDNGKSGIKDSNVARKSAYGNFTSDALVAAMRVSLTGEAVPRDNINNTTGAATMPNNVVYKSSFVWLPRPDLFLTIPAGTSEDDWTLRTGITKSTSDLQRNGTTLNAGTTFKHNYYTYRYVNPKVVNGVTYVEDPSENNTYTRVNPVTNEQEEVASNAYKSDVTKTVSLENGDVPTLGEGKMITAGFNHAQQSDGYYYYKFYLNLWIEGTDTEARRAMDTGNFKLYIEFGNSN